MASRSPKLPDLSRPMHHTFLLVHGAWHDDWSWHRVQDHLERLGHTVICPNLEADNVQLTFQDDANRLRAASANADSLAIASHSRGFEAVARLVAANEYWRRVLYVAAFSSGGPHDFDIGAHEARYTQEFLRGRESGQEDGISTYRPSVARKVFYNDVQEGYIVREACRRLRPQREPRPGEAPLLPWPEQLPLYPILGEYDRVLRLGRAARVFQGYTDTTPITFPWGHTPQLSRPTTVAGLLVDLADRTATQRLAPNR